MPLFQRLWKRIQRMLKTEKRSAFCVGLSSAIHLLLLLLISILVLPAAGRPDGDLVAVELAMEAAMQNTGDEIPLGESDPNAQPDDPTMVEPEEQYNTEEVNQQNLMEIQELAKKQQQEAKKELAAYLQKQKQAAEAKKQALARLKQASGNIGSEIAKRSRYGTAQPQMFYGVRVLARRIIFVLDISGSMDINDAKLQLRNAYQKLQPSESFNLIVYAENIQTWKAEIVPATSANIQSANQWVEQLQSGGATNLYGALKTTFATAKSNRPEIIYFLSDGLPTYGEVQHPLQILSEVQSWNKSLNIVLCVIGLGPHQDHEFLGTLAQQNNGQYFVR